MDDHTIARLSAYLDGELSEDESLSIESELERSDALRNELRKLERTRDWARQFPGRLPDTDVWPRIEEGIAAAATAPATSNQEYRVRRSRFARLFDSVTSRQWWWTTTAARRFAIAGLAGIAIVGMGRSFYLDRRARAVEEKSRLRDEQLVELNSAGVWTQTAAALRGRDGAAYQIRCPRFGQAGPVWGSGLYTDDSSICTAAVHAGLITFRSGGVVNVLIGPGQSEYRGSLQNGVQTRGGRSWEGSFSFLTGGDDRAAGAQPELINWSENAVKLRGWNGKTASFRCPAGGKVGVVWGTTRYTDDSSICSAAVHAGIITPERGGVVTIEVGPRLPRFIGSTQHGIQSRSYGPWAGSYVFVMGEDAQPSWDDTAEWIDWSTSAREMRGWDEVQTTFRCPAGGEEKAVWGSTIYTDDSSICTAAVHEGLITFADGGTVTIEMLPGMSEYAGETRHGVTTRPYGSWAGSFRFVP